MACPPTHSTPISWCRCQSLRSQQDWPLTSSSRSHGYVVQACELSVARRHAHRQRLHPPHQIMAFLLQTSSDYAISFRGSSSLCLLAPSLASTCPCKKLKCTNLALSMRIPYEPHAQRLWPSMHTHTLGMRRRNNRSRTPTIVPQLANAAGVQAALGALCIGRVVIASPAGAGYVTRVPTLHVFCNERVKE
jgi:hypothetical protein